MAVVALKSNSITNRDATPKVPNSSFLENGILRESFDYVTTGTGDSANSTYRFVNVPSNCRVSQILLDAAAMTAGAFDVGVYRNTADGGAVVSQALFGSAVSAASAVVASDVTNESASYTPDKQAQPLWQAAGLSSDPGGTLDIVATCTTGVTAGAKMSLKVRWTL